MFSTSSKHSCSGPSVKFWKPLQPTSPKVCDVTKVVLNSLSTWTGFLVPLTKNLIPWHQRLLIGGRDQAVDNTPKVLQGSKNMHITLFLVHPAGLHAEPPRAPSSAPSHVPFQSTLGLVMVIQGPLAPPLSPPPPRAIIHVYKYIYIYILFVTAAYVSWCFPSLPSLS